MKTVSVSELKAKLSQYLREVRRGGEIQVVDRGVPVARLVRSGATEPTDQGEQRKRLIAAGILRAGSGKAAGVLKAPPLKVRVSISNALDEDRGDRL